MHKVTIIGDSISMAYGPVVKERLTGWAEVWQSEENGGTSAHVLEHLDEWALDREADVIHFNCGLHDLAIDDGANNRIALPAYAENLRAIVTRLRKGTKATLIWATTTSCGRRVARCDEGVSASPGRCRALQRGRAGDGGGAAHR